MKVMKMMALVSTKRQVCRSRSRRPVVAAAAVWNQCDLMPAFENKRHTFVQGVGDGSEGSGDELFDGCMLILCANSYITHEHSPPHTHTIIM